MKNKILITILLITVILFLHENAYADNTEYFTFELGSIIGSTRNEISKTDFDPISVSQIGYMKFKDSQFLHIFWGSLNGEHEERTSYIFGEIGYEKRLKNPLYYLDFSLGIGRVDLNSDYLSTANMYTERIALGYKDYYISIRHMSNGGRTLGNKGENKGRNTLTFGIRF